jgi:phosphate transport system substrate-binding protein
MFTGCPARPALPSMAEALGLKDLQLSNINRITFSHGLIYWQTTDSEVIEALFGYFDSIQAEEYEGSLEGWQLNIRIELIEPLPDRKTDIFIGIHDVDMYSSSRSPYKIIDTYRVVGPAKTIEDWGAFLAKCVKIDANEPESDRLNSWSYISEQIIRPPDWQRIVVNSQFNLGEYNLAYEDSNRKTLYNDMGNYPKLDGSTVAAPMAMEFARQHIGFSDSQAKQFVAFNTTHTAFELFITRQTGAICVYMDDKQFVEFGKNRTTDLLLMTHPSDEELKMAAGWGHDLIIEPICYDAFVFITHKNNPVSSLSLEQIRQIYAGSITNWQEVGGPDVEIQAFQREPNSGSQTGMEQLVMQGQSIISAPTVPVLVGMDQLVDAVAEYKNDSASIGYTYLFYIDNLYKNEDIKILDIEGISPIAENLKNSLYPLTVNYYAVIRAADIDKTGGKFLDWILSPEGQLCIEQAGYIPFLP